jgi:hypothetical protein
MMREWEGIETMQEIKPDFQTPTGPDVPSMSEAEKIKKGICPSCDETLTFQEGCKLCVACGWGGCE